ncbi:methyl viologen resistance protein SmvA [Superficieibacter electus]|uniref:Methyl viologen resistance protein SmvA n=1 Tax=Superficieibacter electus TaxID=2022662 RepID=A0A2P5GUM3_9ENTR|nr:SmvA family efflux MFS transporter [Superficieibacter electus]POP40910.1 methyl viologen resistance protein SmvA [Superficieibacter electus]POP50260.1 methyl viologen resistance protein SmvA [Superficieibacter electus]
MSRQWLTLVVIVLVYIPVAIDATVLHVAAPTLSVTLGASGNQLLWIIDIYSLVMAGLVLPMGALGDRIGYKRLLMLGSALFGIASLLAAFAHSAEWLIMTRVLLAGGAAMILPATLAGIRLTFTQVRERNIALGIWTAVGSGGAAFGPLIGGMVLAQFHWSAIFLINVPIILAVLLLGAYLLPRQPGRAEQPLNLPHALLLISAILLLVYGIKTGMKGQLAGGLVLMILGAGAGLLAIFIRLQLRTAQPMIDLRLFTHRIIVSGVVMAMTAMIALVGFELLMAQELQFVHGMTPFAAGLFMLPVMVASGFSGPVAGILVSRLGLRCVATGGMALSALSFLGLSMTSFSAQPVQAGCLMALLGFSAASALLASTAAIMAAAPQEKAAAAGAIETMAYELGAGLGIALFGVILSRSYADSISLPAGLTTAQAGQATSSIAEAVQLSATLDDGIASSVIAAARQAFITSHSVALSAAGGMLLLLAAAIWFGLANPHRQK